MTEAKDEWSDSDAYLRYDGQRKLLIGQRRWSAVARLAGRFGAAVERARRLGTATKGDLLEWVMVLGHACEAYDHLGLTDPAITARRRALAVLRKAQASPLDLHYGYLALASACESAGRWDEAYMATVRAITMLMTRSEAEHTYWAILRLVAVEEGAMKADEPSLRKLAEALRRQSRWAHAAAGSRPASLDISAEQRAQEVTA